MVRAGPSSAPGGCLLNGPSGHDAGLNVYPLNGLTFSANYVHSWWNRYTLNVNLNGRMQGKTCYPGYEDAPGYGVWNLNTSHNVVVNRHLALEPSFGIDNIFNQVDRRVDWNDRRYANYLAGTAFVFGLRVRFD